LTKGLLRRFGGSSGLALVLAVLAAGCGQKAAERGPRPAEVVVTRPITAQVVDYQDFTGRLSALKTVEIRARVSGYVTDAPFKEGDVVHKGQVLFQIDDTVYAAAVDKARSDVTLYEAQKRLLEVQVDRLRRLVPTGAAAREDFDTTVAKREQASANIAATQALVKTAEQDLEWTKVRAPHTGRVSKRFVDPGNLVNKDNTILTTLVTEDPVHVDFDMDERTFLNLTGSASPGQGVWLTGLNFPVLMRLANEDKFEHVGTINFIDNQVSGSTGTIKVRGQFANPSGTLKPGLFARVRLPVGPPYSAVLISDEALLSDQGRKYVYVLNAKDEAIYRPVTPGQSLEGLRVIKSGLAPTDRVIVNGMQRVRRGAAVIAQWQDPPPRPASPLGKLLPLDRLRARPQHLEVAGQKSEINGH
jgi:multidrug efflux system membrane fusion protein